MSEPELGAEGAIGCKTSSAPYEGARCTSYIGSAPAPNPHNLAPGDFFILHQWRGPLAPYVHDLIQKPGGCLLISVTIQPERQNYPEVAFAVFNAAERQALRRALEACRRRRQKSHDVAHSALAGAGEGKDSGANL
jgi:hypothetical protein